MLILHQSFNINFTLHQSKNLMKSRLFSKRNKNWPNAMFATILLNFRNSVNLKKRLSKDTSCGFMRENFNARPVITSMHLTKKSLLKCMTLQCSYAQTVCSRKTCLKFTEGNALAVLYIFSWLQVPIFFVKYYQFWFALSDKVKRKVYRKMVNLCRE